MANTVLVGLQVLFALPVDGTPVRFGVPLPRAAVARGLGLRDGGTLQWRRLPVGGDDADPVWVEIAIDGPAGTARVVAGGAAPTPDGRGPAFVAEREERVVPHGRELVERWRWRSGEVDERVLVVLHARTPLDGETFDVGERRTRWSVETGARAAVVCLLPRQLWVDGGVLPPDGPLCRRLRRHLARVRERLVEMPGERGAGDFVRSGGTVTNLEYDTPLALLHLALARGDDGAFAQALRAAHQLRDRDLDLRTGLPFRHGPGHRTGVIEGGHAWPEGVLLAGLLTADDSLIEVGKAIARALADRPPRGAGPFERARDHAWPLLGLEALLAVDPDPLLAAAADRLAASIDRRFDGALGTWRFGEGEQGGGDYLERGWITGGVVLPALRRHLARRPDPTVAGHVRRAQQTLLDRVGHGRAGLPTHWRWVGGRVVAEHRVEQDPRAVLLLEGLGGADRRRLLRREEVRDCLLEVPSLEDPDLPTSFTMVARCRWVLQ